MGRSNNFNVVLRLWWLELFAFEGMKRRRFHQGHVTDWLLRDASEEKAETRLCGYAPDVIVINDDDEHVKPSASALLEFESHAVSWPHKVVRLCRCLNPHAVAFHNKSGAIGGCLCAGVCDSWTCLNAVSGVYCGENNFLAGPMCGNRMAELKSLRLVRRSLGLGVGIHSAYTLEFGTVVGEYCGVICREADFTTEMRQSGYGFEFTERSSSGGKVFICASECGSICRFVNHSCNPNCRFEVRVNGVCRKVIVVIQKRIEADEELTIFYNDLVCFHCRCSAYKDK
jgi:hypothetical protein